MTKSASRYGNKGMFMADTMRDIGHGVWRTGHCVCCLIKHWKIMVSCGLCAVPLTAQAAEENAVQEVQSYEKPTLDTPADTTVYTSEE